MRIDAKETNTLLDMAVSIVREKPKCATSVVETIRRIFPFVLDPLEYPAGSEVAGKIFAFGAAVAAASEADIRESEGCPIL